MDCEDFTTLQEDLCTFVEWDMKWGMEVHPQKCVFQEIVRQA